MTLKYETKLKELRRLWKLADPSMRKVIEKRARCLKLAEESNNDPEVARVAEALFQQKLGKLSIC